MAKNTICLWYDRDAEAAARFYAEVFPDSAVHAVHRAPSDYPAGRKGDVLTVDFTMAGVACIGLNAGPTFRHSEAFSFQIATDDQADARAARDALEAQHDRLRHILLKLQRHQFGRKSERLPEEQPELGLADLETAIAKADAEAEKRDPALKRERTAKRRASRGALPAHLPRIEVVLAPESTACPCCAATMV